MRLFDTMKVCGGGRNYGGSRILSFVTTWRWAQQIFFRSFRRKISISQFAAGCIGSGTALHSVNGRKIP